MLRLSYPRLKKILVTLILSRTEVLSKSLANKLNVSERTIRSDVGAINEDIKEYDVQIVHRRNRGYGFLFDNQSSLEKLKKDLSNLNQQQSLDTSSERIKYLLSKLLLSNLPIYIDDILDELFISSNTLNGYITELRRLLRNYHLQLFQKDGKLMLKGDENDKRYCLVDQLENKNYKEYVIGFSKKEKQIFSNVDLNKISQAVNLFLDELHDKISDYNRKNILVHVALTMSRIKAGYVLSKFDKSIIPSSKYAENFDFLFKKIKKDLRVEIPPTEKGYIIYHIMLNNPQMLEKLKGNNDELIKKSIRLFLDKIHDNYSFNLADDQLLLNSLFQHIKSLVKINSLRNDRKNPLLGVILSTFPLAYEMTSSSVNILEKQLGLKLSKDEISFITLHIGSSMERLYNNHWKKRNVAIICGSGTATANLLKVKLKSRFKNYLIIKGIYSYAEYQERSFPRVDFLISTVPIMQESVPVIQIDLANFANDSKELYDYNAWC